MDGARTDLHRILRRARRVTIEAVEKDGERAYRVGAGGDAHVNESLGVALEFMANLYMEGTSEGAKDKRIEKSTAKEVSPAPAWVVDYVAKLRLLTGHERGVEVYVADEDVFNNRRIGVTDNPSGYVVLRSEGADFIVIRRRAPEGDYIKNLICHEFVHLMYGDAFRIVGGALSAGELHMYMTKMEQFTDAVARLLRIVDLPGLSWDEGAEEHEDNN